MRPKRPYDPIALAKLVGDIATGQVVDQDPDAGKDANKVAAGRKGGAVGGAKRAQSMTPKQRSAIAKKAATARWSTSEPVEVEPQVGPPSKKGVVRTGRED